MCGYNNSIESALDDYMRNNLDISLEVNTTTKTLNMSLTIRGVLINFKSIELKYLWKEMLKSEMDEL